MRRLPRGEALRGQEHLHLLRLLLRLRVRLEVRRLRGHLQAGDEEDGVQKQVKSETN